MSRLTISGGRIVDPSTGVDEIQDVHIAEGKITALGEPPPDFLPEREIDASARIVAPGLIDLSARLREPGEEHKATIASETRAAAKGGITTLCIPPDTDPIIDTPAVAELIRSRAAQVGMARVEVIGALTQGLGGEHLAEMGILGEAGCVGVANGMRPIVSTEVMRRALEYATTFGLTVFLCAEDPWLGCQRYVHDGVVSAQRGLPGIPETAETVVVARDLLLVEQTGARAHFCRLSTARAVHMVHAAQARGFPVTADVALHHLFLTELDVLDFDSQCHVRPPFRTMNDRDGLREGVRKGSVTAICSDHQPHERDARLNPFTDTQPGISALETLLPLGLRLVDEGILDLLGLIDRLTYQPAQILGLSRGTLRVGAPADICIIDPHARWTLDEETLVSRGQNTPFFGHELKGQVTHTLLGGRFVYEAFPSAA